MNYNELYNKLEEVDFDFDEYEEEDIVEVEAGDWISGGKYEYLSSVYSDVDKTVFIRVSWYRTGSHFTDWDYGEPSAEEVKPKSIQKTIYVRVQKVDN